MENLFQKLKSGLNLCNLAEILMADTLTEMAIENFVVKDKILETLSMKHSIY